MFATEPIVLCLSLLSGFADALIFTFLESFSPIFRQWNFGTIALGLAFIPLFIGYCISYLSFIPFIRRDERTQAQRPDEFRPEQKLYWVSCISPTSKKDCAEHPPSPSFYIPLLSCRLVCLPLRGHRKVSLSKGILSANLC